MGLRKKLASLLRDEEGQSMTEYILILAVVVMVIMKFKEKFNRTMDKAVGGLDEQMNGIFNGQ